MNLVQNNKKFEIDFNRYFYATLCIFFALLLFSVSTIGEESKLKPSNKTDAEILKSLDTIKNQINNDLFLIEEENNMKANDSFDNINLDLLFSDSKSNSHIKIKNKEEKTINKLDKSNLTDFEDGEGGEDTWWSDVIEDIEIEDID